VLHSQNDSDDYYQDAVHRLRRDDYLRFIRDGPRTGAATTSGGGTPTGTVTFFVCNPTQVSGGSAPAPDGTQVGSPVTTLAISGSEPPAATADSNAVTANMTGIWCSRAVYAPGGANASNYTGSNDATAGECFTVTDTTGSTSAEIGCPTTRQALQLATAHR